MCWWCQHGAIFQTAWALRRWSRCLQAPVSALRVTQDGTHSHRRRRSVVSRICSDTVAFAHCMGPCGRSVRLIPHRSSGQGFGSGMSYHRPDDLSSVPSVSPVLVLHYVLVTNGHWRARDGQYAIAALALEHWQERQLFAV